MVPAVELESDRFVEQDQEIFSRVENRRKYQEGFYRFLKHPVRVMMEEPYTVLFVSVPAALLLFIGGFVSVVTSYGIGALFTTTMIDDFFVFALLIAIVPLALLDFKEAWRISSVEASLPNFFRDVAGMNDSGMTLPHAIHIVSEGEYGALTPPHIRKLDTEMSWGGVPFVEAIRRFGKAVKTPLAERSVDLIAHASSAGGDVSEVLRAAAHDAYEFFNLQSERKNGMMIYMIIILMSFFVFLFVIGGALGHLPHHDGGGGRGGGRVGFELGPVVHGQRGSLPLQPDLQPLRAYPGIVLRTCSGYHGRRPGGRGGAEVLGDHGVYRLDCVPVHHLREPGLVSFFVKAE